MTDETTMRSVQDILDLYRTGDEHSWAQEFAYLAAVHGEDVQNLADSIAECGMRVPILLGSDGRVWDGHHRLAVAYGLGIDLVPVTYAGGEPRD